MPPAIDPCSSPQVVERDLISFDDEPVDMTLPTLVHETIVAASVTADTGTATSASTTATPLTPPVKGLLPTDAPSPIHLPPGGGSFLSSHRHAHLTDVDTSSLTPRTYQRKLFELAKDRNIIAVMNTGSGKTLVAVMLIKEMLEREAERIGRSEHAGDASPGSLDVPSIPPNKRLCFFVVNSVPLVFQQAAVIRSQCPARVVEYCGDMRTDYLSRSHWERQLLGAEVIVLTAQILAGIFQHGFLKMNNVALLIFDECHHARNDHPYHSIMRNHYHTAPKELRPKIFGMTASPSSGSAAHLAWCARELELNLDATIYTADTDTVRLFVPQPKEIILCYRRYPITHIAPELLKAFGISDVGHFNVMSSVLSNLGPWCMSRLLQKQRQNDIQALSLESEPGAEPEASSPPVVTLTSSEVFRPPSLDLHHQRPPQFSVEDMTPKTMKLIQLLWESFKKFGDEFCCIVFVERRYTAFALGELLRELEMFKGSLRVGLLIGHGGGSKENRDRSLRMTFNDQNRVIASFRNKTFNLLVATRVAEEGLDIPSCNVVVRFDPTDTAISYVQSRGRARQHQSLFVLMLEHDNRKDEANMDRLLGEVRNMELWCRQLEDDKVMRMSPDLDKDVPLDGTKYMQTYVVPSTGAKLTMDSAVALVYHYCSKLPTDEFSSTRPEFEITASGITGFICQVTLPASAPVRRLESDVASTKNMAKKSAAFKACEQLHRLGALNDHLLPISEKADTEHLPGQQQAKQGSNAAKEYPIKEPSFWIPLKIDLLDNTVAVYATIIRLSDDDREKNPGQAQVRPLCLLTPQPLPEAFPQTQLFVDNRERSVVIHRVSSCLHLSLGEAEKLQKFTVAMFSRTGRRKYECDMQRIPYFIAPLHAAGRFSNSTQDHPDALMRDDLAWSDIEPLTVAQPELLLLSEEEIQKSDPYDLVLATSTNRGSDCYVKTVLSHVSLDSEMRQVGLDAYVKEHRQRLHKKNLAATAAASEGEGATSTTTVAEPLEYESLTVEEYLREKYQWTKPICGPIVLLERTKRFRNHLQPVVMTIEKDEFSAAALCALDQCCRIPIAASILRAFAMVPSVLVRLNGYLLTHELQVQLSLQEIPIAMMLEALTAPSANMAMHYERLELLGDSFLKFSCTIRLFIINPAKDEGQLHLSRIHIVSNHALLQHALKLEIYRHICSTPFHRKGWRPSGYSVDGNSWATYAENEFKHVLSNKTLADVVEATLGAAFLVGGSELGLKAAKALLIPFPEFENWDAFSRVHTAPTIQPMLVERNRVNIQGAEAALGYKFKNPMYFLEAMTHASTLRMDSACYQRLEFLGDAVLDFLVVRKYYLLHPDSDPGTIVMAKDNSVSNRILGALAIDLGLYRYLDQFSAGLMSSVANAVVVVEEFKANQALKRAQRNGTTLDNDGGGGGVQDALVLTHEEQEEEFDFWLNISIPKVLGDMVESTIGAVFVDSGFDFAVIENLFERLIWPFINRHVTFEDVTVHPTKALLELLQAYGCMKYAYDQKLLPHAAGHEYMNDGTSTTEISFRIHDHLMATVTSQHAEQCKKETSAQVLRRLRFDPTLLGRLCTCPKRKKAAKAPAATTTTTVAP